MEDIDIGKWLRGKDRGKLSYRRRLELSLDAAIEADDEVAAKAVKMKLDEHIAKSKAYAKERYNGLKLNKKEDER